MVVHYFSAPVPLQAVGCLRRPNLGLVWAFIFTSGAKSAGSSGLFGLSQSRIGPPRPRKKTGLVFAQFGFCETPRRELPRKGIHRDIHPPSTAPKGEADERNDTLPYCLAGLVGVCLCPLFSFSNRNCKQSGGKSAPCLRAAVRNVVCALLEHRRGGQASAALLSSVQAI